MPASFRTSLTASAQRLLAECAELGPIKSPLHPSAGATRDIDCLRRADLIERRAGAMHLSAAGRAYLARAEARQGGEDIDPFLAQHVGAATGMTLCPQGSSMVRLDQAESPLVWLARRKDRDRKPLIASEQLLAGERLRADFTLAQLMPLVTANWSAVVVRSMRGAGASAAAPADAVVAARQRVRHALAAVGPEFSGLLLDVCCFLKGLEDVERERRWPSRSAKVVLQLGLDRLARYYGLASEARGRSKRPIRTWLAPDAAFVVD